MLRACPKLDYLALIDEVFTLNLSLREVKQETKEPQTTLSLQQREKHKHRTPKGLRSLQHRKMGLYS